MAYAGHSVQALLMQWILAEKCGSGNFEFFHTLGSLPPLAAPCSKVPSGPFTTVSPHMEAGLIGHTKPPSEFLLTGLPLLTHTLIIEVERLQETPRGRFAFLNSNDSDQTPPRQ